MASDMVAVARRMASDRRKIARRMASDMVAVARRMASAGENSAAMGRQSRARLWADYSGFSYMPQKT
jgi:hypothetical protein